MLPLKLILPCVPGGQGYLLEAFFQVADTSAGQRVIQSPTIKSLTVKYKTDLGCIIICTWMEACVPTPRIQGVIMETES